MQFGLYRSKPYLQNSRHQSQPPLPSSSDRRPTETFTSGHEHKGRGKCTHRARHSLHSHSYRRQNLYKLNKRKEALAKYNLAASIAVQRPPWESSAVFREELSTVISNRSTTLLELGDYLGALTDAETVIAVRRNWPKGHFRKAKALVGLGQLDEAIESVSLGLQFEPNNAVSTAFTHLART